MASARNHFFVFVSLFRLFVLDPVQQAGPAAGGVTLWDHALGRQPLLKAPPSVWGAAQRTPPAVELEYALASAGSQRLSLSWRPARSACSACTRLPPHTAAQACT